MPVAKLKDVLRLLRTKCDAADERDDSDAALLERFLTRHEQAALGILVERHGPMVLRTCRAVLRDEHDAQDAFQATFLVLAVRARAIRRRGSVASWLHGVALRVAAAERSRAARRRRHERARAALTSSMTQDAESDPVWADKRAFIEKHNMVVWRFHDHWHMRNPDGILAGMVHVLGWEKYQRKDFPY